MSTRAGALALLALVLLPGVGADHVYSHRLVIDGRLLGNDGLPLPGRTIELATRGDELLAPCLEGMRTITDEFGDFVFCYHHHELDPSTRVSVSYGNVSVERAVDIATRRMPALLREPNETGIAPGRWNETYRVLGRAWRPGPVLLENVQVYGDAVKGLPVNLTVHFEDGSEQVFRSATDGFGDFDLVVETAAERASLSLSIEADGRAQPVAIDTFFHRTYAPIYLANEGIAAGDGERADPPERAQAPGNTTPKVNPVLVVAVAVGLVLAIVLSRRKSA